MNSLNVKRVSKKFHEMFESKIDLSDVKCDSNCFETRALAALALMIKCGVNEVFSHPKPLLESVSTLTTEQNNGA